MKREALVDAFRQLGAREPDTWAASQVEEGIPQLHRFAFLKEAWNGVVAPGNPNWIDAMRQEGAPASEALNRLLAAGIDQSDLAQVVRAMQTETLFSASYALDCPEPVELPEQTVAWGLFAVDEDGAAIEALHCLHESVCETDPELAS